MMKKNWAEKGRGVDLFDDILHHHRVVVGLLQLGSGDPDHGVSRICLSCLVEHLQLE